MVKYFDCDPNRPTCLYDFTIKNIMFDYQAFSIRDFNWEKDVIEDYFFSEKGEPSREDVTI